MNFIMPAFHLLIKGKVQGVFYRATAKEEAERLGVTGWVRNTKEGCVEAVVSGTAEAVEQFIKWCRQGPPRAFVTDVEITETAEENFSEFKVIR